MTSSRSLPQLLGGGANLVDLMREGIEQPGTVVGISRIPLDTIEESGNGGLWLGGLVRNSQLAAHSRYVLCGS